jgi:MerR family mercuric resistance operon transcriptional regulator
MNTIKTITIGVLAKEAGVGIETIRFYEKKGLIQQPKKTTGYRHYPPSDVRKIKFIKRAQILGFTLNEAKELLEMEVCTKATRPKFKSKAQTKIKEVEDKIESLKRIKETLKKFEKKCGTQNTSTQECGILDCFENDWDCC